MKACWPVLLFQDSQRVLRLGNAQTSPCHRGVGESYNITAILGCQAFFGSYF